MNVLVTSASRKVGLVRAFQQALAAEGGGRVVAVDASPLSAALYAADRHHLVRKSREDGFLDEVSAICRREEIGLLVPTRDEELPLFAASRERFAREGTQVMVAAPEAIRACQDKARFLDACAAAGLATPARVNPGGPVRFPVFVKPRVGKGGRGIQRVDGPDELAQALRRVPDALVQAYVEAPEFTIDLFADLSGRVLSAVPRERVVVFGGESFVSRVVKSPEIAEASRRLAEALGLIGHNTIQCFFDGEQVLFIEVNPRYGGAAHLSFAAGAPSPRWLVRLVQGKPVDAAPDAVREGLVMLRYTEDLYLEASQLAKRELV